VLRGLGGPLDDEPPVLLAHLDTAPHGDRKLALRACHLNAAPPDLYLHPGGDRDRRSTYPRHLENLLIDEAEDLAADPHPPGLVVGENAPGGREDRHPETVQDPRDLRLLAVDAPSRTAR
jgi:hypothetical protein